MTEILEFDAWKSQYIEAIRNKTRKSSVEKTLLEYLDSEDKTKVKERVFNQILTQGYKAYKKEAELKILAEKASAETRTLIAKLKHKPVASNSRKKRAHELITLGTLTELVDFPKDRGVIAGAYLYILDEIKKRPEFENELKLKGDEILAQREAEKEQQRLARKQNKAKTDE